MIPTATLLCANPFRRLLALWRVLCEPFGLMAFLKQKTIVFACSYWPEPETSAQFGKFLETYKP